jgi:hypothetical protein
MTEDELKIWFWDLYNSCYPAKHKDYPDSIFMVYDINFIRAKKLGNILGKEVEYPTEIKGECLFEIEYNNKYFWYSYSKIYCEILKKHGSNFYDTRKLVNKWVREHKLSNKYNAVESNFMVIGLMDEKDILDNFKPYDITWKDKI